MFRENNSGSVNSRVPALLNEISRLEKAASGYSVKRQLSRSMDRSCIGTVFITVPGQTKQISIHISNTADPVTKRLNVGICCDLDMHTLEQVISYFQQKSLPLLCEIISDYKSTIECASYYCSDYNRTFNSL